MILAAMAQTDTQTVAAQLGDVDMGGANGTISSQFVTCLNEDKITLSALQEFDKKEFDEIIDSYLKKINLYTRTAGVVRGLLSQLHRGMQNRRLHFVLFSFFVFLSSMFCFCVFVCCNVLDDMGYLIGLFLVIFIVNMDMEMVGLIYGTCIGGAL